MTVLVVSVHADDGVFSTGEFIANQVAHGEQVAVWNLCSVTAPGQDPEWQDTLNNEHVKACLSLGAISYFGPFVDGKWSPRRSWTEDGEIIRRKMKAWAPDAVLFPLGIHHPDHVHFAAAMRHALVVFPARVAIYEDLPYRVLYPEEAAERRRWLVEGPHELEPAANGGYYDQKLEACMKYESQWGDDARRCVMAPERIWWVK